MLLEETELKLRWNTVYSAEDVGLETPLVFDHSTVEVDDQGFEGPPLQGVRAFRCRQTLRSQVSPTEYDQAVIPIWMIEARTEGGFFRGVLRPYRDCASGGVIAIRKSLPRLDYYLEEGGRAPLFGQSLLEMRSELLKQRMRTLVMPADRWYAHGEIDPRFNLTMGRPDGGRLGFVTFKATD